MFQTLVRKVNMSAIQGSDDAKKIRWKYIGDNASCTSTWFPPKENGRHVGQVLEWSNSIRRHQHASCGLVSSTLASKDINLSMSWACLGSVGSTYFSPIVIGWIQSGPKPCSSSHLPTQRQYLSGRLEAAIPWTQRHPWTIKTAWALGPNSRPRVAGDRGSVWPVPPQSCHVWFGLVDFGGKTPSRFSCVWTETGCSSWMSWSFCEIWNLIQFDGLSGPDSFCCLRGLLRTKAHRNGIDFAFQGRFPLHATPQNRTAFQFTCWYGFSLLIWGFALSCMSSSWVMGDVSPSCSMTTFPVQRCIYIIYLHIYKYIYILYRYIYI